MALNSRMSNAAAIAGLNAILALLNVGGAGRVEIRTGTPPANLEDAPTGTLLATLVLSNPAFPTAVDANPGARALASAIADDVSADATGDPGWYRAFSGAGTAVLQGSAGTSGTDMILPDETIVITQLVTVVSWATTLAEAGS